MIVVDTSALMAILLGEAEACMRAIEAAERLIISAGTLAEALVVAERRGIGAEMQALIEGLGFEVASVTAASARGIAAAYARWGKGCHPAGLNFGDAFAYDAAKTAGAPLLFIGEDFSKTDVLRVLAEEGLIWANR
jgi:ribonuclease VapC